MAGTIQYVNYPSPISPVKNPMICSYRYSNSLTESGFYYEIKTYLNGSVINWNKIHSDLNGYGVSNTQSSLLPYLGSVPLINTTDVFVPISGVIQPYTMTIQGIYTGGSNTLFTSGNLYALDGYHNTPQDKKNWDYTDYIMDGTHGSKFLSKKTQTQKVTTYANCQGELRCLWGSYSGDTTLHSYGQYLFMEKNGILYFENSSGTTAPYYHWNTKTDPSKYCLSNQFTPWSLSNYWWSQIGVGGGSILPFTEGESYSLYLGNFGILDGSGGTMNNLDIDWTLSSYVTKNTATQTDDNIRITGFTCSYSGYNFLDLSYGFAFPNPNMYYYLPAIPSTTFKIRLYNEEPVTKKNSTGNGYVGYNLTNGFNAGHLSGLTCTPSATYTTTDCIYNLYQNGCDSFTSGTTSIVVETSDTGEWFIMNLKDTSVPSRQLIDTGGSSPYNTIVINSSHFTSIQGQWDVELLDSSNNPMSSLATIDSTNLQDFYYISCEDVGVQATKIRFTCNTYNGVMNLQIRNSPFFYEKNNWYSNSFAITEGEELYVKIEGTSWSGTGDVIMYLSNTSDQGKLVQGNPYSVEYPSGENIVTNADSDIHSIQGYTTYNSIYRFTPTRTGNSRLQIRYHSNAGSDRLSAGTFKVNVYSVKQTYREEYNVTNENILDTLPDWYDDFHQLVMWNNSTPLNLSVNALSPREITITQISEKKNYEIICPKYPTDTLNGGTWIGWKNSIGGFDYQLFDLKVSKELEIERPTYKRNNIRPVFDGTSYTYDYDKSYGEEKVYHPNVQPTYIIRTELSSEELIDIKELFYSDSVYEYVGKSDETMTLPIIILDKKVSFSNDRKNQLVEITYKYSDSFIC